jgi:hypothetical protein
VTALPEPSHLRAVTWPSSESLDRDGLALAYAALERLRSEHGLHRLSVVVDDPVLGRQVLVVPRGELPTSVDDRVGWSADPLIEEPATDLDLAVALCRTTLRVEAPADPVDSTELALRRLEGVEAVAVDGDVIRVQVGPSASAAVAADAISVVRAHLERSVVVELTRADRTAAPAPPAPAPPVGRAALEVVAVRTAPESGELEVHLRAAEVRTIGRASLTRGLVGAAEATLDAWHARPGAPARRVAWARAVETSADGRFVVAVAIEAPATQGVSHGIGTGPNPVEAAVHATADALAR